MSNRLEEVSQLFVNLLGTGNRLGDLGSQELTASLPQPMDGYLDRAFGLAERLCKLAVRHRGLVAAQVRLQVLEELELAAAGELVVQAWRGSFRAA